MCKAEGEKRCLTCSGAVRSDHRLVCGFSIRIENECRMSNKSHWDQKRPDNSIQPIAPATEEKLRDYETESSGDYERRLKVRIADLQASLTARTHQWETCKDSLDKAEKQVEELEARIVAHKEQCDLCNKEFQDKIKKLDSALLASAKAGSAGVDVVCELTASIKKHKEALRLLHRIVQSAGEHLANCGEIASGTAVIEDAEKALTTIDNIEKGGEG